MKHIVKFNQVSDANNYEIKNVPFLTTVGENNQLLICDEENKKIVIDGQGNANIVDAGPSTITIHYAWGILEGRWREIDPETNIYEPLQQDKVVNAPYTLTTNDFVLYHTDHDHHHFNSADTGYILGGNIGLCHYGITPYGSKFEYNNVIAAACWDDQFNPSSIYFKVAPNFDQKLQEYTINQDITIYINIYEECLVKDTIITLSDGTTKMIQDITYDDELLVWDFDNAQYSSAKPLWIKAAQKTKTYWLCKLENGIEIKSVGSNGHRLFNYTDQVFEYPQDCVGKDIYTENGISKLVSCECINEEVEYYNIITVYHMNLFANSILTSCRYNNIYDIKDMKFIKDNRNIVDFAEYNNSIPYEYYVGMRLGEQTIPVNDNIGYVKKLLFTKKYVD